MSPHEREIAAVLVRYATAVDTKDWALFRSCFADAAEVDYGDIGRWTEADEFTEFMGAAQAGFATSAHLISNIVIDELDERTASSKAYVHAINVLASGPGDWIESIGSYTDRLTIDQGVWKITHRTLALVRMTISPSLGGLM